MISIVDEKKLRRILARMLDEKEFLGPHGIRALSRHHLEHPYVFRLGGQEFRVGYVPGDSDSGMFGGNSNWRGPVWMPVNFLIWTALLRLAAYYGDSFKVECPTGSGKQMNLFEVARELAERLISTFTRDASGRRPVYGGSEKFQSDPHWRDHILFYEYFHGDNGAGIGASHQTGWTGAIARMIQGNGLLTEDLLYAPRSGAAGDGRRKALNLNGPPGRRARSGPRAAPAAARGGLPENGLSRLQGEVGRHDLQPRGIEPVLDASVERRGHHRTVNRVVHHGDELVLDVEVVQRPLEHVGRRVGTDPHRLPGRLEQERRAPSSRERRIRCSPARRRAPPDPSWPGRSSSPGRSPPPCWGW